MPRIRPTVFHKARAIGPSLPRLLPICRDLTSARNELRWLGEHAKYVSSQLDRVDQRLLLADFVRRRSLGEPLQYILGSEFFGDLEIQCRRGVLIPRQETAASVSHLVHRICNRSHQPGESRIAQKWRVLDLCTGTGCVPLLFHHEFYQNPSMQDVALELVGVDVSTRALSLARENLIHQIAGQAFATNGKPARTRSLHGIGFVHADVLADAHNPDEDRSMAVTQALQRLDSDGGDPKYDILIANPPYISPRAYQRTTSPSVRKYEPKLALVPSRPTSESDNDIGDHFYPHLLHISKQVNAKIAMFEVADLDQAKRVVQKAKDQGIWDRIEIWRDEPALSSDLTNQIEFEGRHVPVIGKGLGRSVFLSRNGAT